MPTCARLLQRMPISAGSRQRTRKIQRAARTARHGVRRPYEAAGRTLSGGQRQALTLLMATMVTPKILLLDEHTAALDPATAEKVLNLTKR